MNLSEFIRGRGISEGTLSMMRVESGTAQFEGGAHPAIVFGYYRDGQRVNYKARALDKKLYKQQKGGEQRFYNLDRVLSGPLDVVYIVEGEMDCLSMIESGFDAVLSVPSGAPSSEGKLEARKYEYVINALKDGLNKVTRFVLVTDNDDPGRFLRADLARLLGVGRCWFVDWPEGTKDANEALVAWGAEGLRDYVREAETPWPVEGLYELGDIPEPPKLELWKTGWPEFESIRFAPTLLSIGTGYPGHGKSHLSQNLWFNIARDYQLPVALLSAETRAKPFVRRNLRQFYHQKRERDQTDQQHRVADEWITEHFKFMQHDNPTFTWLLETIEAAVVRFGVRAAVIDPWNKLDHDFDQSTTTETKWIGQCLDELIAMARGLNIHIQILAHPSKSLQPGTKKGPPAPELISGSMNWYNRPDLIWAVHRAEIVGDDGKRQTEADFYLWKARFEELGFPTKHHMDLDLNSQCFRCTDYENEAGVVA